MELELVIQFYDRNDHEEIRFSKQREKSRDESKPCELFVRSLERLQGVLQAPSMNNMKSRLEMMAKQQGFEFLPYGRRFQCRKPGSTRYNFTTDSPFCKLKTMGFHFTEATCYLTADLFYLEVLLLPSGEVQEVKVASHGEHPVPSNSILHLLRSNNFADFSVRLGELFAQYNIPGDNETQSKLLTSLKYLWKDLQQISDQQNELKCCETQMGLINNGRVGFLMAGEQDYPLSLYFYISPNDGLKNSDLSFKELSEFKPAVQAAQVTIGVSDVTHKLQMTSVISQPPRLDNQGCPALFALSEVPNEMLSACFLLRLKPPIPVLSSFIERVGQITDVTVPVSDLQWAPLPKLLIKGSACASSLLEPLDKQEIFTVLLPDSGMHTYILPETAWVAPTQRAALMDGVPFTHPAHVSAILELLRHQCAVNSLLSSCLTRSTSPAASVCDLHFEVRPESTTSISVTFNEPHTDSLAVLLVNVSNPRQITCKLFGVGLSDPSLEEYMSTVMKSCMSIPVTMRTLYIRLEEIATAPLFTSPPSTREAQNDHSSLLMDTDGQLPAVSQSAAMPEHNSVPDSACSTVSVAKSELHPEINAGVPVSPYPFVPVCVMANCQS